MSIFLEQHHDKLLLEYLSIDDIVVLSQVSKYYYKLTKDILRPFRIHHTIGYDTMHKIYLNMTHEIYIKFSINNLLFSEDLIAKDSLRKMMMKVLKACKYGGIKIIEYYCKRYINIMNCYLKIDIRSYENSIYYDDDVYTVLELAIYICICNNNMKAIKFLCSLASSHKWYDATLYEMNDNVIKHYCGSRSDEVLDIIEKCGYFEM